MASQPRPSTAATPSVSQPALHRMAALSKIIEKMSRLFGSRLTAQCVHQGGLEMRKKLFRLLGHAAAEKPLHQDAAQRAHEQRGIESWVDRLPEQSFLSSTLQDVGEEIQVDALQLVHVTDEVSRMLLLAQDEAQEELHRIEVLGNEGVVLVDEALDLIHLGESGQVVEDVDEVGLEGALDGGAEQGLLVVEVPEDQRLRDLGLLRHLRQGGVAVALRREQPHRGGDDLLPRVHALLVAQGSGGVNGSASTR